MSEAVVAVECFERRSGLWIEGRNHAQCVGELFVGELHRFFDFVEAFTREQVEAVADNFCGASGCFIGRVAALKLQQKAVAQVASGDAGGVERAHQIDGLADLIGLNVNAGPHGNVVGDFVGGAGEISVAVDITDDVSSDFTLNVGEVEIGELCH